MTRTSSNRVSQSAPFLLLVLADLKAIISDKAIAITLFGGVLFYSILYPLPYLNEVPTAQQLVVVDLDNSSLSRTLVRHTDASPKLELIGKVATLSDAKHAIESGKAHGVLVIPEGFRRDLYLGRQVTLSIGGDANYFLVYSAVVEGLVSVGIDTQKQVQFAGLLKQGSQPEQAKQSLNSVKLNSLAVFNPNLGYMGYVVPGVLLLVLHQTLLIGAGILGAGQWQTKGDWLRVNPLMIILARLTAFAVLYSMFSAYYLGYCYYFYDLRAMASLAQLGLFMLPYILSTAAAGIAMSCLFSRRDLPTQVVLLISMPLLFLTGFIWPLSLIPEPLIWLSQLVPAIPGIMAMLKLNQMGAEWSCVFQTWLQLWALFAGYILLAYVGISWRRRNSGLV